MNNGIINSFPKNYITEIFSALEFASIKHRRQKRKGSSGIPYINHPVKVTHLLLRKLDTPSKEIIIAALLHDTLEDTKTLPEEIENLFGDKVLRLVQEVTDDMSLSSRVRKNLQIDKAGNLSTEAGWIKIADKTSNILDILTTRINWTRSRKIAYIEWAIKVIHRIRDKHPGLIEEFKGAVTEAETILQYKFKPEF